jgi:hypothetical protein
MSSPATSLPRIPRFDGEWMLRLRDLAWEWVRLQGGVAAASLMAAYTDLIFAFGLARLGEAKVARRLVAGASPVLGMNEVHQFLLEAYTYRIKQVLEGKPHEGPLPAVQMELLSQMHRMPMYTVDRLRQHSRILEPDEKIDPYRYWGGRISELDGTLGQLADLTDKEQIRTRVHELLKKHANGARGKENTARILRSALNLAPRIGDDFAREMLERVTPAHDALPEPTDQPSLMDQARFLENALGVAVHFDRHEYVHPLVTRFEGLVRPRNGARTVQAVELLIGLFFHTFRKLGLRDEIDRLLTPMTETILGGGDLANLDWTRADPAVLRTLLHIALGWEFLGLAEMAEPILCGVRQLMFADELSCKEKTLLACAYAMTVGQFRVDLAQAMLEELFRKLTGIRDTYRTADYYNLSQLDVLEAVILAICANPTVVNHP